MWDASETSSIVNPIQGFAIIQFKYSIAEFARNDVQVFEMRVNWLIQSSNNLKSRWIDLYICVTNLTRDSTSNMINPIQSYSIIKFKYEIIQSTRNDLHVVEMLMIWFMKNKQQFEILMNSLIHSDK